MKQGKYKCSHRGFNGDKLRVGLLNKKCLITSVMSYLFQSRRWEPKSQKRTQPEMEPP
jgi:hypothetical protein